MKALKVERTTYQVDGVDEPCIMVGDGFAQVRISALYHYIGKNTLLVSEFLDGENNGEAELIGDFESLTDDDARKIALGYSVYIR